MALQFQHALTFEEKTDLCGRMLGTKQEVFSTPLKRFEYLCSRQIQTRQP